MKKSIWNSKSYSWGTNCTAWSLVATKTLSVKQEQMPPMTSEKVHFHTLSQQFFYILDGSATIVLEHQSVELKANEGFLIPPGIKHQIKNHSTQELHFLVISEPSTFEDRTEESF